MPPASAVNVPQKPLISPARIVLPASTSIVPQPVIAGVKT